MNPKQLITGKHVFLFDFDGVVTDSEVYAFATLTKLVKDNYGVDIAPEDASFTIGLDSSGTAAEISRKYNIDLSGDRLISLLGNYPVFYTECGDMKAFPHLEDLFISIKENHGKIGIVSSTIYKHLESALKRLGLFSYPSVIISGDNVRFKKPAPEPYIKGMAALGGTIDDTIVFEDSPVGILSAKRAGLSVIAFCGSGLRQDVSSADAAIYDYSELL